MQKLNCRKSRSCQAAVVMAAVGVMAAAQQAGAQTTGVATYQASLFAPTGSPLFQPDFGAPTTGTTYGFNDPTYIGYQDFVDNGSNTPPGGPGQIFTVTSPFTLTTLTVKGGGGASAASAFAGNQWTISLGTVPNFNNGAVPTIIDTETVDVTGVADSGRNSYVSFNLANPLPLTTGVNYIYMIHRTGGGAYYGFAKSENTVDHLANAAAMYGDFTGAAGTPPNTLVVNGVHNGPTSGGFQDRTFFLNGTVGTPAVTFGLANTNWVKNGSGAWEAGTSWGSNPVVPGALGSNVTFDTNGGAITALNPVVTLGQAATLTTMTFDRPGGGYTINNSAQGAITLTAEIDVLSGNHTINVPVTSSSTDIIFSVVTGSSLKLSNFSYGGYAAVRAYGGGTVTLGGVGNCTLHTESPDAGATPGANLVLTANTGILYALILDATSSVNTGANSVLASGVYGAGTLTIPAGGTLYDAVFGDNPFFSTTLVGAGSVVVGNQGNAAAGHFADVLGNNVGFSGTMTAGTNATGAGVFNQFTLRFGAASDIGDGSATNKIILNGGILQARNSFVAPQAVTVTSLAGLPVGSTITSSTIDTNGFDMGVGPVTSAGPLTKIGAGKLTVGNIRGGTLTVAAGSMAIATSASRTAGVSVLDSLTLAGSTGAWTTTLDLANNDLIIHNGDIAQIRDQLKQGYNLGGQNGTGGILSSAAAASTTPKATLGYGTFVGTIDGQPTTATDVVIRYTLAGDATLDLSVGFGDLVSLAQNYNLANRSWSQGDFNYDASVNFADLVILAQNYNNTLSLEQIGSLGSDFASDFALAQSLVPEPTTLGLLGGVATLVVRRRRANA